MFINSRWLKIRQIDFLWSGPYFIIIRCLKMTGFKVVLRTLECKFQIILKETMEFHWIPEIEKRNRINWKKMLIVANGKIWHRKYRSYVLFQCLFAQKNKFKKNERKTKNCRRHCSISVKQDDNVARDWMCKYLRLIRFLMHFMAFNPRLTVCTHWIDLNWMYSMSYLKHFCRWNFEAIRSNSSVFEVLNGLDKSFGVA